MYASAPAGVVSGTRTSQRHLLFQSRHGVLKLLRRDVNAFGVRICEMVVTATYGRKPVCVAIGTTTGKPSILTLLCEADQ